MAAKPRDIEVGEIILVKNDGKRGPGPDWVASVVVDVHSSRGGSVAHSDESVFLVTTFYPALTLHRSFNPMLGSEEGTVWKRRT